jgi:hypothetical protein
MRRANKLVFNRQVRPNHYLLPVSHLCNRRALAMTSFHQFGVFAASRGEGLHPKLRALLERAALSPFSEVSMRHDGLVQAGPNPDSEVVPSRVNVTLFARELARPVVAAPKPEMHRLATANPKRNRIV